MYPSILNLKNTFKMKSMLLYSYFFPVFTFFEYFPQVLV